MSSEYGEIVAIPLDIKNQQGKTEQISVYNPLNETPQFAGLLQIIQKWVMNEFDIDNVIPFITKVMCVVNQAVSSHHAGEYKKKLVLSLLYCCVKASSLLAPDKEIAYSILHHIAPSAIDTIVAIAKGQINVKQTLKVVEKNCLSIFDFPSTKNEKQLTQEIQENKHLHE